MKEILIKDKGCFCEGCNREFDFPDYLQLDHKIPKSEGGDHDIKNRMLLCGPCNLTKGNTLTLTGLQKKNKKMGFMSK